MDLSQKCLFCESTELDTMTITVDNEIHKIGLCEDCEEAPLKAIKESIKEHLQVKQNELAELEEIRQKLQALGLDIVPINQTQPQPTQTPALTSTPQPIPQQNNSLKVLKPRPIDAPSEADGMNLGKHESYLAENVTTRSGEEYRPPKQQEVESQVLVGRDGKPMTLPKHTKSEVGDTTISIVEVTDNDIQQRFKNIAQNSLQDGGPDFRKGYESDVRAIQCKYCRGTGIARIGGKTCKGCSGTGVIG